VERKPHRKPRNLLGGRVGHRVWGGEEGLFAEGGSGKKKRWGLWSSKSRLNGQGRGIQRAASRENWWGNTQNNRGGSGKKNQKDGTKGEEFLTERAKDGRGGGGRSGKRTLPQEPRGRDKTNHERGFVKDRANVQKGRRNGGRKKGGFLPVNTSGGMNRVWLQ